MEAVISIALGVWISAGGWIAYRSLKKEFANRGGTKK